MFATYCFNFYHFNEGIVTFLLTMMKVRTKENSTLEVSTFRTMEDSLFDKTGDAAGKFCFWLLDIRFLAKIETKCSGLGRI